MPVDCFSHTGALAHGILSSGEVHPSHAVFGAAAESARGEEEGIE
jgi:hypothetical protein